MSRSRPAAAEVPNWSVPAFVAAAILLGGSSLAASNFGFAFQILSLLFLLAAAFSWRRGADLDIDFGLAALAAAVLALPLLHLIPLPASIWADLPGRAQVAAALALGGLENPSLPLSLHAQSTIRWALSALPIVALVAHAVRAGGLPTIRVAQTMLALAAVSFVMGVMQIQGGPQSPFYIHDSTNSDLAVGFFANANHLATYLLLTLPIATAMFVLFKQSHRQSTQTALAALAGLTGLVTFGIYMTASVAGLLLVVPTALASAFLLPGLSGRLKGLIVAAVLIATAAGVAIWRAGYLPLAFVGSEDHPLSRVGIARTAAEGVREFWPVGSGLGSFPVTFPLFEDVAEVERRYANHAHNEYLELVFEAGIIGVALIAALLLWWTVSSFRAWRSDPGEGPGAAIWKRAASIVTGVVLLHSIVDYPARTPAILVIFAFFGLVLGTGSGSRRKAAAREEATDPAPPRQPRP